MLHARLAQIEGHHHTEVVVETQRTAEDNGGGEPPELGLDSHTDEVELADEAERHRDTGQREHHHRQYGGQVGTLPEQAAIAVQRVRILAAIGARHHADDAKGAKAGEQIHQQVDPGRFHRHLADTARHDHRQQITKVGDGGVAQHPLDVALYQCQQVADEDGDERHGGQQPMDHGIGCSRYGQIEAQQYGKYSDLADGCKEGGDRCRCTFVDIRCPEVEGGQRELEGKTDQHQTKTAHQQRMVSRALGHGHPEGIKAQAASLGIEQRHTKQQEGGGSGREHHVLHRGFQRVALAIGVAYQTKHRQGQHLDPDKEGGEVAGASQHQTTGRGDQQQQEELFSVIWVGFQPRLAEGTGCQRTNQHQSHVEDGIAIDLQQRGDPLISLRHDNGQGEERQVETNDGDGKGGSDTAAPRDGQHQGCHGPGGQQQGKQCQQLGSGESHCRAPAVGSRYQCSTLIRLLLAVSITGWG